MFRLIFCMTAFLFAGGVAAAADAEQAAGPRSVEEIQEIIRDYLLDNPEVLFEAVQRHRERQRRLQAQRDRVLLQRHRRELLADPDSFVGGNPAGDVTLVEFFDYQCGHCKRFASTLESITRQDPQLRVVYKELPVLGPESFRAAQAALAARNQGYYLEFHEALMRFDGPLTDEAILAAARSLGLDVDRLKRDMEAPKVLDILGNNHRLADALGIDGTPAVIVGEEIGRGAVPLEDLAAMIAKARTGGP